MNYWPWLLLTGMGGLTGLWVYVYFGSYWHKWRNR